VRRHGKIEVGLSRFQHSWKGYESAEALDLGRLLSTNTHLSCILQMLFTHSEKDGSGRSAVRQRIMSEDITSESRGVIGKMV
jgi:hypothetical protein